ncbi:MAG: sodium/proton-translocating pyrophosphatase, partial [Candidatus Spechtbacterales bacterium]
GLIARAEALAGFAVGALACGLLTAFAFTTAGSAWDSAKRSIETQGSGATPQERSVAVSADMVGDPLKDAVGLSMNPLMKTVAILALLLAPLV